jgi:hypothetical protein
MLMRHANDAARKGLTLRQAAIADLNQLQPLRQTLSHTFKHRLRAELQRVRDRVFVRQCEGREHRGIRRQHRLDERRVQALPGDRLLFVRVGIAFPGRHTKKLETHRSMRVGVLARDPGKRDAGLDTELLVQLARQSRLGLLAGFDLAAGKFPVPGVGLA